MPGRRPCTKEKGDRAESAAASFLEAHGFRILARNYRCRGAEIDIIAEEGPALCFVEVRSVASRTFGDPLETVVASKQARLIRAARHYIASHRVVDREIRFDVVGIVYQPRLEIALVRGAFETMTYW